MSAWEGSRRIKAGTKGLTSSSTAVKLAESNPDFRVHTVAVQAAHGNSVNVLLGDADAQTVEIYPGGTWELQVRDLTIVYVRLASGGAVAAGV